MEIKPKNHGVGKRRHLSQLPALLVRGRGTRADSQCTAGCILLSLYISIILVVALPRYTLGDFSVEQEESFFVERGLVL